MTGIQPAVAVMPESGSDHHSGGDGLTELLVSSVDTGSQPALDAVFVRVYAELRGMARQQLAGAWRAHTLDTTALIHEAYLKLIDGRQVTGRHRGYFFGAAARAMRQVLVDAARRRQSEKRGGGQRNLTLEEDRLAVDGFAADLISLDQCLDRLAEKLPRPAQVVECRFFGGLSIDETAEALDVARRTVVRDWELARAWLFRELDQDHEGMTDDDEQ